MLEKIMLLHKLFQFLMECNLASKYGKQWKPSKKSCEFSTLFFHLWKKEKIVHCTFTVIIIGVSKIKLRNTPVPWLLKISVALFSLKWSNTNSQFAWCRFYVLKSAWVKESVWAKLRVCDLALASLKKRNSKEVGVAEVLIMVKEVSND